MRKKLLVLALFIAFTGSYNKEVKATSWGMTTELRAFIEKLTPPSFTTTLKDVTVKEGQSVRLSARFTGNPVPSIEVFKNGERLQSSARINIRVDFNTVTITINEVYMEDAGGYTIKATNPGGTASTGCNLKVKNEIWPARDQI